MKRLLISIIALAFNSSAVIIENDTKDNGETIITVKNNSFQSALEELISIIVNKNPEQKNATNENETDGTHTVTIIFSLKNNPFTTKLILKQLIALITKNPDINDEQLKTHFSGPYRIYRNSKTELQIDQVNI